MNLFFKYCLILIIFAGLSGLKGEEMSSHVTINIEGSISAQTSIYQAGDVVVLNVSFGNLKKAIPVNAKAYILLSSSYGSIVLSEPIKEVQVDVMVPNFLTKKSGILTYSLFIDNSLMDSGSLEITPNIQQNPIAESYIGPPSIFAGGTDFTMLVITPTDLYDNLLPNNTSIIIREQFQKTLIMNDLKIENRIAWKRIYSPNISGRVFAAATIDKSSTKEMPVEIYPAAPENFSISYNQIHPYADGHQILTLETSVIKDAYNNIISDGTLVEFNCNTDKGALIKTSATTINGIATAQLLYPSTPSEWNISGTIPGIASSQERLVSFTSVLEGYDVTFSTNNTNITVGPITSFLEQLVPDGTEVTLTIYRDNLKLSTTTKSGFATFKINTKGAKTIKISTLGFTKTYTKVIK